MEKFTSFLKKKYQSLSDSREVTNANKGKEGNKIQNYLDRIERITSSPRGKQLLQHMIMKDFVMKDDEETLTYLARALYQSEKKIAIERGQTNQIQDLEQNDSDLLNKYRNAILEKRNIQKRTLDSWLSYLGNTNDYPMWFKYYTARSLKDMGQFNRHDTDYTYEDKHSNEQVKTVTGPSYSNRTEYTIAPFPELNSEALGFVRKAIETQIEIDSYTLPEEVNTEIITHTQLDDQTIEKIKQNAKPENIDDAIAGALKNLRNKKRSEYINTHKTELQNKFIKGQPLDERREDALTNELTKRLDTQDFAKLYAFAMVECAGSLDRSSLEGEWVKYNKGSDYTLLEDSLKGKGTGWCTAEGSAKGQIENGDFYVYYTKNKDGQNTEPRIAIRMDSNGQIGEIRGVEKRQEMEPELVDTAKEFYKDLPGSDKYEKKDADMKYLTSIYNRIVKVNKETKEKTYQNIALSKEELRFLYEMDSPIESFGYDKDPRIAEILSTRNVMDDAPVIFNCTPDQIANNIDQVNEHTVAYIGPWNLDIYQKMPDTVHYLYESFPEKKIFKQSLELTPKTPEQYETELITKGNKLSSYSKDILQKMPPLETNESLKLVSFSVEQLGFPNSATVQEIYDKAREQGLDLCPPQVGPQLRINYIDQPNNEYLHIAMEPISGRDGRPVLFGVGRDGSEPWLSSSNGEPDRRCSASSQFVCVSRN